jgi:hypothetical protein
MAGRLFGEQHSDRYAETDSKACSEIGGQFQGNDTDEGANVPAGLNQGFGEVVKHRIHAEILDRIRLNVNPQRHGVIAPVLSDC